MREAVKALMSMEVYGDNNKKNLELFGIKKEDQNYQTAVAVRLVQKALVEGDTSAIRLIGELTGDLNRFGLMPEEESEIVEMAYPAINLPDNGRTLSYMAVPLAVERHTHCCWRRSGIKMSRGSDLLYSGTITTR